MRARRRRNRQGGRRGRRCWASPCIWVRVWDGRFIVALPSETEWRDPCSRLDTLALATTEPYRPRRMSMHASMGAPLFLWLSVARIGCRRTSHAAR
jgi:hypothetical protein